MAAGIILQARLTSKRFPNKMLCTLMGKPVIQWCIESIEKCNLPYCIAIPNTMPNQGLAEWVKQYCLATDKNITMYEGHEEDLTLRFFNAANTIGFDPIIRICGDSPFFAPEDVKLALELYNKRKYKTQINHVQVFGLDELKFGNKNNPFITSREHVVQYMDHTVDFPEDIKRLTDDYLNEESPTMIGRKKLWNIHK